MSTGPTARDAFIIATSLSTMADKSGTEQDSKACVICGEPGPFKCSRCPPNVKPHYCSAEHQKIHWNTSHKANCGSTHQPQPIDEDLDSPNVTCDYCNSNMSFSNPAKESEQGLMCGECGAIFCHACTYDRLMTRENGACPICGVACPCCSKQFGGTQISEASFLKALQATSDRAPNDHKNKSTWNMLLGEKHEASGNEDKAIQCFLTAGAAGFPLGYTCAGRLYCRMGDVNNGRRYALLAANDGSNPSAKAMHNLGCMHAEGQSNSESALEWWTKAVDWGYVASCTNIGSAYLEGSSGVDQNKKKAVYWYQRGAEGGDFDSMYRLARRYRDGDGTKRSYKLSKQWYEKAAEGGDVESMYHMGQLYSRGWGVERDMEQAKEWFHRAASHGDSMSEGALRMIEAGALFI